MVNLVEQMRILIGMAWKTVMNQWMVMESVCGTAVVTVTETMTALGTGGMTADSDPHHG